MTVIVRITLFEIVCAQRQLQLVDGLADRASSLGLTSTLSGLADEGADTYASGFEDALQAAGLDESAFQPAPADIDAARATFAAIGKGCETTLDGWRIVLRSGIRSRWEGFRRFCDSRDWPTSSPRSGPPSAATRRPTTSSQRS